MPIPASTQTISTARLDLVVLPLHWLEAVATDREPVDLGFTDPYDFLPAIAPVLGYRRDQLRADASAEPWLLRAIVWRVTGEAVGYVNFHAPPDENGMIEIGYQVVPPYRRRGVASEAAQAM